MRSRFRQSVQTWHSTWHSAWRSVWMNRPARERRWLQAGAGLLALLLLWPTVIAPAWSVWREAPARQARLDTLTHRMLQLHAQAKTLQTPVHIDRREALDELRAATDRLLGPGAQLQPQGEQLRVTLQAASATGLAQWLLVARDKARARPLQATLAQASADARDRADAPQPSEALWQGFLLVQLP